MAFVGCDLARYVAQRRQRERNRKTDECLKLDMYKDSGVLVDIRCLEPRPGLIDTGRLGTGRQSWQQVKQIFKLLELA